MTSTQARAKLASLLDEVVRNRETVVIRRRRGEDVVLIAAAELSSLQETVHLLHSPKNAERLLAALARARNRIISVPSLDDIRADDIPEEEQR